MAIFNNPEICTRCLAKCCRYFMLQIDTPSSKDDFENIRWYLAHRGVSVVIDMEGEWHIGSGEHEPTSRHAVYRDALEIITDDLG